MKHFANILITFLIICSSVNLYAKSSKSELSTNEDSVRIIYGLGTFHGDEVALAPTDNMPIEGWLGVFETTPAGFELKKVKLRVEIVRDEMIDDETTKSAKKISIWNGDKGKPVFLVKPSLNLKLAEGPIKGSSGGQQISPDNSPIKLKIDDQSIGPAEIDVKGKGEKHNGEYVYTYTDVQAVLKIENKTQILWPKGRLDPNSSVVWYGDLDRDGKLDLILNLTDHYNISNKQLFLSSPAMGKELLKNVGGHRTTGC